MEQAVDISRQLVRQCKEGDRTAQFEIYKRYNKAMFNICFRMLGNREEAEDVLQDSFVDAFMKIDQYREDATFGAWLKRLVINHCINELRKRKIKWVSDEYVPEASWNDYVEKAEPRFDMKTINGAIATLPEGYRVVFNLYLLEGYDHAEIAQILEITESTSKSQYLRAKKKLQNILVENENRVA